MARKTIAQKKKDAKKRVRGIKNPLRGSNLANKPARIAFLVLEGAKLGAEILIEQDPANIIRGDASGGGSFDRPAQSRKFVSADEALAIYRNEQRGASQSVPITAENLQVLFDAQPNPEQAYNDARDLAEMNQDQELENALAKLSKTRPTKFKKTPGKTGFGSGRFQSQFGQNMGFNFSQLSKPKRKRTSKMKASDKKLSKAFKQANLMCRKKNGQFKKGKSQKDVAKCAHRLRKKMK